MFELGHVDDLIKAEALSHARQCGDEVLRMLVI
jgi:hypothetical protein